MIIRISPFTLLSVFLISIHISLFAQQPIHKVAVQQKKSQWSFGLSYLSDNVYQGRKDSVALPYISPSIAYHDKSGFFITGAIAYLPISGESRIDRGTIEGGWSHTTDHFNAELSVAKDFYSSKSYSVSSEISGRVSAYLSYDVGPVEPSLDLGASFGDSHDFGLGVGLEHSFTIIENKMEIGPGAHVNAGTENYYSNYFEKRRYSADRNGGSSSGKSAKVQNPSKFQIMDYELTAALEYTLIKKLKFNFTPTYAIPVNPSTITTTTKTSGGAITQSATESLSNTFFYSIGVNYTF